MAFNEHELARIKTERETLGPTFALLRDKGGLWHRTGIEGLRGILASGAIHPNDGRFPVTYSISNVSHARRINAVSLFEFQSSSENSILLQGWTWITFLTDQRPATVWIRIDPAQIDTARLLLPPEILSWRDTQSDFWMHKWIPHVEALYRGPVPCSAFVEFVIFKGFREWVPVPVCPGALETIERLGQDWHAEAEAEYAEHLRNGGIDWKRLRG